MEDSGIAHARTPPTSSLPSFLSPVSYVRFSLSRALSSSSFSSKERREYERMPEVERSLASWRDEENTRREGTTVREGIRDVRRVCENEKVSRHRVRGKRDVDSGRAKETDRGQPKVKERGSRGVSMATRRGGNATVTMAAAGSSLGPTCLSLFLVPRPLRSPLSYGPLFLPPTDRATSDRATDPQRERRWSSGRGISALSRKLLASPFCSFSRSFLSHRTTIATAIARWINHRDIDATMDKYAKQANLDRGFGCNYRAKCATLNADGRL